MRVALGSTAALCVSLLAASAVASRGPCGRNFGPACPACNAAVRRCGDQRIRRNFLSLARKERRAFLRALDVVKTTSWYEGVQRFGPAFRPYDYFVQRHAQAAADPVGDRAHGGPWFLPYHRLFLLELEEALLAVDPSIGALPYWDITQGYAGILGPGELEFGSLDGTAEGFGVEDGFFAHWRVGYVNSTLSNATHNDYYIGNARGELRHAVNSPDTTRIIRYPGCSDLSLVPADWERCQGLPGPFSDWYECTQISHDQAKGQDRPDFRGQGSMHLEAHQWLGSLSPPDGWTCSGSGEAHPLNSTWLMGDMYDFWTSTNDPVWALHHANLDRSAFHYALEHQDAADRYYDYPAIEFDGLHAGLLLGDVVTPRQPFAGAALGLSALGGPAGPLTHADALCWVGPRSAPYTYDSAAGACDALAAFA